MAVSESCLTIWWRRVEPAVFGMWTVTINGALPLALTALTRGFSPSNAMVTSLLQGWQGAAAGQS